MTLPILYSLRNCPYAMRARVAIYKAKYPVILRDIVLSNKPPQMLSVSPKGTVPVLVLDDGRVIDESFDIMNWVLTQNDPGDLTYQQQPQTLSQMHALITTFDTEFKGHLEQYRCAKRYKENDVSERRKACENYLAPLEQRLSQHSYLFGERESLADIALMPFFRQFARVERQWYLQAPYPNLRRWLNNYLQSKMFSKVMTKHELWTPDAPIVYLGYE